jgi:hypothetical protein
MIDIVERLRTWTDGNEPTSKEREAAAEIERLNLVIRTMMGHPEVTNAIYEIARRALEEGK